MSIVNLPEEVDLSQCTIYDKVDRSTGVSMEVLYKGKPMLIQTPETRLVFDLNPYRYPNSDKEYYSLHLELDETKSEGSKLIKLLNEIDKNAKNTATEDLEADECKFYSSVKRSSNPIHKPHLRCKLVSNKTRFKFTAFEDDIKIDPTIETMMLKLKRFVKVKCIIQLNPIWKVNNKCGVSYQVKHLKIINEHDLKFKE